MEKVLLQQTWKFYIKLSGKQDNSDEGLKTYSSKLAINLITLLHYHYIIWSIMML